MLPAPDVVRDAFKQYHNDARVVQALSLARDGSSDARKVLQTRIDDVEAGLAGIEVESLARHRQSCGDVINLHTDIQHCLAVLSSMDDTLGHVETSLESIASSVNPITEKAVALEKKIAFSHGVHVALTEFLESCSVSPELQRELETAPLDTDYMAIVGSVEAKLATALQDETSSLSAAASFLPRLLQLRSLAVSRVREFLTAEVSSLGAAKVNGQSKQTDLIERHRRLYAYLTRVHPRSAFDVRSLYIEVQSGVYAKHFAVYLQAMAKCTSPSKPFHILSSRTSFDDGRLFGVPRHQAWLVERINEAPSPPGSKSVPFAEAFRSAHRLLCDSLTFEMAFLHHFFGCQDPGIPTAPAVQPAADRMDAGLLECNAEALLKSVVKPWGFVRLHMQRVEAFVAAT